MAIREEHDFLSENERAFLFSTIHDHPHVRADGRELMQQRKIRVQFRRTEEQAQAEVQLGRTRVIANVHGEIVPPFPDRPTEGFLHFNVELSPMASQNFEVGRPSPMAVELARIVDRGIRECRALDTEALAIIAGEKVWAITCNIHVVDHGGNLVDCVSLAAIAAMMHYRRPEVSVQNNSTVVYNIDEHAAVPLSLHHIPISISFCFIESRDQGGDGTDGEPIIFMDPTDREERITDGSMTFTFNSFRELCAVHKIGGAAISTTDVLRCANIAAARVSELTEILKEEAEKADKEAIDRRRAFLRGRDFADISSLSTSAATQNRQEVDLGAMTDFKMLHAPIALRDDPTAEENDAKVTSMAQLLESLETAADISESTGATLGGLEMSDEAREEFKKLTESMSVRSLVSSAATASAASLSKAPSAASAAATKKQVTKVTKKKKPVMDSDSEEESVVVQSEFNGTAAAPVPVPVPEVPAAPVEKKKPAKKTKKKAVSSDSDEEEQDLSAAIKRKPRKRTELTISNLFVLVPETPRGSPRPQDKFDEGERDELHRVHVSSSICPVYQWERPAQAQIQLIPTSSLAEDLAAMHKRVKVCIRVRPNSKANAAASGVLINQQEQTISVITNAATGNGTCFHFDQVLDAKVDQAGVFQAAACEVVENVLSGYNGTVMAYGQTGAGKTFTMSGGKQNFQDRGICARSISAIFQQIQKDAEHEYAVRVSYVEVYNENLFDLLDLNEHAANGHHSSNNHNNAAAVKEDLVIQENDKGQTFIKRLTRPLVKSEEDAFDLLFQGETNRTIAEHCLNAASTRSHCIFTIYLEKKRSSSALLGDYDDSNQSPDVVVYSKLNLVDLAGSERMKKTGVSGTMLKEASHINKSLTFLEQVVIALGDKKRQHIPYRQTTLTNLLKDSLGGNCRTLLMACVWPDESHNDQSLATLKFATRMMRVKTSAIINVAQSGGSGKSNGGAGPSDEVIEKYVQEIKRLKQELAMYDTLNGRSRVDYDAHKITSPASQALYREQIRGFLRDSSANPLPVVNLLQAQQLFHAFRNICLENQSQQAQPQGSESKMVKHFRSLRGTTPPDLADMKRLNHNSSGQMTKLPLVTRISQSSLVPETPNPEDYDEELIGRASNPIRPPIAPERKLQPLNNKNSELTAATCPVMGDKELFELFKKQENPKPESLLDVELAKANLRQAKAQLSTCGLEVNKLKMEIDGFSLTLQELRDESLVASVITIAAEEGQQLGSQSQIPQSNDHQFLLVMQLKDAKKRYRDTYERFQERKAEVSYLVKIKDQMLTQLTREFEAWKQQRTEQQPQFSRSL